MAQEKKKVDQQTISLFLTLAVLTALFVFGLSWAFLAPNAPRPPVRVESATK